MRELLTKKIILPLSDWRKNIRVHKYLTLFEKLYSDGEEAVFEYQKKKLKSLLIHSYENIPYYNKLFKSIEFDPFGVKSIEDFSRIPPLTREDIQENFDMLVDKKSSYKAVLTGASSGSTGQAVRYLHDEYSRSAGFAAHYLGWQMAGFKFGDKGVHVWGNPKTVNESWKTLGSRINSRLLNVIRFPAFYLNSEQGFHDLYNILKNTSKIKYVDGYTNAIYLFARYLADNNLLVPRLKYIITTGENLHDFQRDLIELYLGPVFDEYGCGEIMGIAYQGTESSDYRVIQSHVMVNMDLSIKGDDTSRPLLITDLDNYVMPLIKYKNGDLGVVSEYQDQKTGAVKSLKSVSGRVSDIIELPEGGSLVIPSFFGSSLLKDFPQIVQYQVVRVAIDKLTVKLVVRGDLNLNLISQAIATYLNGKIGFEIKVVDRILRESNGKYKLVVDNLNKNG